MTVINCWKLWKEITFHNNQQSFWIGLNWNSLCWTNYPWPSHVHYSGWMAPYLVKPQHNSLGFKLTSCCGTVSAPLFPASPHHLLSVESDKILKECEKQRIPRLFSSSCSFLKILPAWFWRGLFQVSEWMLNPAEQWHHLTVVTKIWITGCWISEVDFCLRGGRQDLNSDLCVKRMGVWRRDRGKQTRERS